MSSGSIAAYAAAAGPGDPEPPARAVGPRCPYDGRFLAASSVDLRPADRYHPETLVGWCPNHGAVEVD